MRAMPTCSAKSRHPQDALCERFLGFTYPFLPSNVPAITPFQCLTVFLGLGLKPLEVPHCSPLHSSLSLVETESSPPILLRLPGPRKTVSLLAQTSPSQLRPIWRKGSASVFSRKAGWVGDKAPKDGRVPEYGVPSVMPHFLLKDRPPSFPLFYRKCPEPTFPQ